MLLVKIFSGDDIEELETKMQQALDSLDPTFDWAAHDVTVQYDGKNAFSRQSYSVLVFIRPNT